jgi:hypothetical protein
MDFFLQPFVEHRQAFSNKYCFAKTNFIGDWQLPVQIISRFKKLF